MTALSQARFDRNIQKMTESGHEFGRRYSNQTNMNRHNSLNTMTPIGLQIKQRLSQERLNAQPASETKHFTGYATLNTVVSPFLQS